MRAFIAIELPPEIKTALTDIQRHLREGGLKARWVRSESIHLTLKFLGEIAPEKTEPISSTMKAVADGFAPFALAAAGFGVFPRLNNARVLWAGFSDGAADLIELQKELDAALSARGFAPEKRPFRGHLTLARFRERVDSVKLQTVLQELGGLRIGQWQAADLVLFQSELRPAGPIYTQLASHPLAA